MTSLGLCFGPVIALPVSISYNSSPATPPGGVFILWQGCLADRSQGSQNSKEETHSCCLGRRIAPSCNIFAYLQGHKRQKECLQHSLKNLLELIMILVDLKWHFTVLNSQALQGEVCFPHLSHVLTVYSGSLQRLVVRLFLTLC